MLCRFANEFALDDREGVVAVLFHGNLFVKRTQLRIALFELGDQRTLQRFAVIKTGKQK